jgi:hypothetical protein
LQTTSAERIHQSGSILLAEASTLVVGQQIDIGTAHLFATSGLTCAGRLKWETEPDTAEIWTVQDDTAEAWTPVSDTPEVWTTKTFPAYLEAA